MKTKTYQLETLACPSCAAKIETVVQRMKGVSEAQVMFNSSRIKVAYDEAAVTDSDIAKTILSLGYHVLGEK